MIGAANPRIELVGSDGRPPTVRARASSWGRLFDCAYSWEGVNLLGMHSPSGMRAHLGTCVHAATAAFDMGRMPGGQQIDVFEAVELFTDMMKNPEREVDFRRDTLTLREAIGTGSQLVMAYCQDVSPMFEFSAVELKLDPIRVAVDRVVIELTGSLDRSRQIKAQGATVTADIKTGAAVVENGVASIKGRSAQCGTYELLGEVQTGAPSAGSQIIALPTSGRPKPMVSGVWDAKRVMVGDESTPGLIEIAGAMFSSGLFPPNPQSRLCSERYCARFNVCRYREPVLTTET